MTLSVNDLGDIVRSIWSTQLGFELTMDPALDVVELRRNHDELMTGTIQISGAWNGAVHVPCSLPLIRRAASAMFATEPDELQRADIRDALGEITNMTAGNIKAMFPSESFLSLPTVVDGTDYDVTTLDSQVLVQAGFTFDGKAMVVTVLKTGTRGAAR